MGDWADEKAREWLSEQPHCNWHPVEHDAIEHDVVVHNQPCGCADASSLASLLVEVQDEAAMSGTMSDWVAKRRAAWRADVLAEVRRVLWEVYEMDDDMPPHKRDEILSRLDKL